MTALAAAIIELEAQRERITRMIGDLRAMNASLEMSYPPHPATAPGPRTETDALTSTPAGDNGHRRRREPTTDHAEAVVGAMRKTAGPMSRREIVSRTKLSPWQAKEALQLLSKEQVVTVTGATISRRYTLAPDFDVVWDGTRERNGQVPNLLPARSQKAC